MYGVMTGISHRHLSDAGRAVGGLGGLLGGPAREATDRQRPLDVGTPGLDSAATVVAVASAPMHHWVEVLRSPPRTALRDQGREEAFLPYPHLRPRLPDLKNQTLA